ESLIATLGRALGRLYGPAFREERLALMLRFAECYPKGADRRALKALRWRQVVPLLALDSAKERAVFVDACAREAWSPERLRAELALRGRPRTALLAAAVRGRPTDGPEPDPDPDCAEFLGCSNSDLGWREVLVRSLEAYLLNLEAGLCLVERNRRFQIGDDDFSLDLVFFHRPMKRLFAIACRVEAHPLPGPDPLPLYLLWLEQNERQPGENPPVGLLLDAAAGPDSLVLRDLDRKPVPWYRSGLPPRSVLRAFFLRSLAAAREDADTGIGLG
ncbi:MAG: PDDEXK nuclease domain-containing protein, partial [bacterium]